MSECDAEADADADVEDCEDDVICSALAIAEAEVENCLESICDADADANASVEDCDGDDIATKDAFQCTAEAIAIAEVDWCDPAECTADADADASVENCEGDDVEDVLNLNGCRAVAHSFAVALFNSNAESDSEAEADGNGGAASAMAIGGALASNESTASADNEAEAEGSSDGFGSEASALGVAMCRFDGRDFSACATNGSTAAQVAEAEATDGGLATAQSGARAGGGGTAVAEAESTADGFFDADQDGERDVCAGGNLLNPIQCPNGAVDEGTFAVNEPRSVAASAAVAVAEFANNDAAAFASSNAVTGGTAITESNVLLAVDSGVFGVGTSSTVGCTAGQQSCGTGNIVVLATGSEGVGFASTQAEAQNGQVVNVSAEGGAPAVCTANGNAVLTQNADGSWSFDSGFSAGLACTRAATTFVP
jgi:hypothetical protein